MKRLFVVIRSRGPAWDRTRPLDEQTNWRGHAEFMDALEAERIVVLAGPLEGTDDAMLVIGAADEEEVSSHLSSDPWDEDMLVTSQISPWTLRIGRELLDPPESEPE
jgi:uncharacterized protein YciI